MSEKTVLVVEDNDLNMKLVQSLLKIGKYKGIGADNAERGLDLAREYLPDLILMDISLPGMDGLTAIRLLRNDPQIRSIPVLALTAHAMEGDESRAKVAGFDGYITKPIDIKAFQRTLDTLLRPHAPSVQTDPVDHHRARILAVDDEPLNLKLLRSMLVARGYHLLTASDGRQALEMVRSEPPDLILLDVMMPDMDGYEVTERLKADPATREIPIIMITALNGEDDKKRGLAAGADEFLNKPINASELGARVASLLRLRTYQQQLTTRKASEQSILGQVEEMPGGPVADALPTVLIVEDDDAGARLMERYLSPLCCRVLRVRDGESALKAVENETVDVMLLDLLLTEMDGFQVCRQIKGCEATLTIQVVMMTSLRDMTSRIRGIEAGTDDFLTKPVDKEELRARVLALFRKKAYFDRLCAQVSTALQAAITDELTGIYNSAYFKYFLDLELKRSQRYKHPLGLLMIDVDNFKQYNDTRGHQAGDSYLSQFGTLLRQNLREIDLAARYGGEEFAVVLPYTEEEGAGEAAEKIRSAVASQLAAGDGIGPLPTVSIGVALYPYHADAARSLIQSADQALYRAKRTGKNRVCIGDHGVDAADGNRTVSEE